jgi:hypothetical protein
MDILKGIAISLFLMAFGAGMVWWHLEEKKHGEGKTIIWIAHIIPIPVLFAGIALIISGGVMAFSTFI